MEAQGQNRKQVQRNTIMTTVIKNAIRIYKKESKNEGNDKTIKIDDVLVALPKTQI